MINPRNQRTYLRYEHKVGIDIDLEDSSIYKHPECDNPDTIYIFKLSDQESQQSSGTLFDSPYFLKRQGCELSMDRKRRLSF